MQKPCAMAASIAPRSSAGIVGLGGDAGAGVPFGDLLQRGGAAGEALADRAGQERAGRLVAQPGDFSGQGGDVLVGAGCLGSARVHFGRVADVNALAYLNIQRLKLSVDGSAQLGEDPGNLIT